MVDLPPLRKRLADWAERALIPLSAIAALIFVVIGASRPVWLDEVSSLSFATQDLHGLVEILRTDTNLPAFYLILHQWIALFGDSEAASRSLSAIFYLGTIVVVFVTGRLLFSDTRSALYCAFFYLISVQAIRQAQNIRGFRRRIVFSLPAHAGCTTVDLPLRRNRIDSDRRICLQTDLLAGQIHHHCSPRACDLDRNAVDALRTQISAAGLLLRPIGLDHCESHSSTQ